MTAQSFYDFPIQQRPNKRTPDCIILNIGEIVKTLLNKIRQLNDLIPEEDSIMELVMESLAYEQNAMLELSYSVLDTMREAMGSIYDADVTVASNAVMQFGDAVFKELQRIKAYHNGYLHYQFLQWLESDVILVRLVVNPEK